MNDYCYLFVGKVTFHHCKKVTVIWQDSKISGEIPLRAFAPYSLRKSSVRASPSQASQRLDGVFTHLLRDDTLNQNNRYCLKHPRQAEQRFCRFFVPFQDNGLRYLWNCVRIRLLC